MKIVYKQILVVIVIYSVTVIPAIAHDTTHIHPLITHEIGSLIRDQDVTNKAYTELYDLAEDAQTRINWGTDADAAEGEEPQFIEDLMENNWTPFISPTTVINGVVQEDAPATKVRNHFKHATTGIGLRSPVTSGIPSDQQAMVYFREAMDFYGRYSDEAKSAAFFHFGMALHHVEDMSSPAHVHNDQHLTLGGFPLNGTDRDDYEGYYLPYQRLPGETGISFSDASTVKIINDPLVDIRGVDYQSVELIYMAMSNIIFLCIA